MFGFRSKSEREILSLARKSAEEEAQRIRLQAKADRMHRSIVEKAQREAGVLPRKRSLLWYPFHLIMNVLRELCLQPLKPWNPYK